MTTQRSEIIAKLRENIHILKLGRDIALLPTLSIAENERIICDLEFAQFAHQHLEGGKVKIEDAVMKAYEAAQEWPKVQDR